MYSRILDIDQQTERLQKIMKKQILGKEKLPKKNKLDGKGGPFIGQLDSYIGVQKTLALLIEKIEVREEIYNKMEAMETSYIRICLIKF